MAGEEPIVESTAAAPPVVEAPAPAAVEAPAAAAPIEAAKSPHEVPTLLESFKANAEAAKTEAKAEPEKAPEPEAKAPEVKPVEKVEVKPEEAKAEDATKPEGETPQPIDWDTYAFKFADNVKADDKQVAAFKERAREVGMDPVKAQGFVDLFNEAATSFVAEQHKLQNDTWNNTRMDWRKEVLASPVLGGSGHMFAMSLVANTRDKTVEIMSGGAMPGSPKYEQASQRVENMLRVTGVGDHPVFLEMLHALSPFVSEPRPPKEPPSPPKNNGVRPSNSLYAPSKRQ